MLEKTFDFVEMQEGDLLTDDVGKLDKARVKGIDAAFGEIFEETA